MKNSNQLYEILKSIDGVSEDQARDAMHEVTYTNDVATKIDLRALESRMATKEDLKELEQRMTAIESRMACKEDLKELESKIELRMETIELRAANHAKAYIDKAIAKLETRMIKHQMMAATLIIAAQGLLMAYIKFFS